MCVCLSAHIKGIISLKKPIGSIQVVLSVVSVMAVNHHVWVWGQQAVLSVHVSMVATWGVREVRVVVKHGVRLMLFSWVHVVLVWLILNVLLLDHVCMVHTLVVKHFVMWCLMVWSLVVRYDQVSSIL